MFGFALSDFSALEWVLLVAVAYWGSSSFVRYLKRRFPWLNARERENYTFGWKGFELKPIPSAPPREVPRPGFKENRSNPMKVVSTATYSSRKLMNKEEYGIFKRLDAMIRPSGNLLFAQVSCGEFLACDDYRAFSQVNSKRVDFLIVNPYGDPVVAVEYQGLGHWMSEDAAARDAVKRVALQSAGIEMIDAYPDDPDIEARVRSALARNKTAARVPEVKPAFQPPIPRNTNFRPKNAGAPKSQPGEGAAPAEAPRSDAVPDRNARLDRGPAPSDAMPNPSALQAGRVLP